MPNGIATSPEGRDKSASMRAFACMRRGVEDAAPYTHIPFERTDVGDGLRTSRELKQRHHFQSRPKVRRTFNFMSPFLGEGGEGDGVSQCGNTPLSVNA